MAIFYVVAGLIVIIINIQNLPAGVAMIFKMAFSVKAVGGGLCGTITVAMMNAMRFGVARGVFSNEAGMGSAAITAAAATTDNPVRQGYINMTGTFWDTIVVCTITGLCIASSGVLGITENSTKGSYQVSGTAVTVEAVDSDNKTTTTDYTYEFTDDQLILTDTSNSSNTLTLSVLPSDELNKDENTKLASELAVEESQAAIGSLTGTWTDAAGNHYTFAEDGTFACSTVIKGAALTILSFGSALGKVGGWLVTIGIVLFAFSTILGWEYHGEKAFEYLFKSHKYNMIYRIVFSLVVYVGATISLDLVWNFSDIANALMAIPNLICLLALSGEIAKDIKEFQAVIKAEKASK